MNDPMGSPVYEAPKKNNTPMIIGIVVVVLLCCCCVAAGASWYLWTNGDALMQGLVSQLA